MRRADRPLKDHVAKLIELSQRKDRAARRAAEEALERLTLQMRDDPVPAYIPSLVLLLQHRASAARVALTLESLALSQPTAQLTEAVVPLQVYAWRSGAPLAFLSARRAIVRALKNELPIPAAAPELTLAELPIPLDTSLTDDQDRAHE